MTVRREASGSSQGLPHRGDPLTTRQILRFWLPLAGAWLMMAAEGPFLAAVIARLPVPIENLAAFGVAFAIAMIVESPVIMLMSASTALARDRDSYFALRRFGYGLNAFLTGLIVVLVLPPVFDLLARGLLRLPEAVTRLTHVALILLLPWPAAIGYRRFHQGLLIRRNLTRLVAYGTVVRLVSMVLTAVSLPRVTGLSGAQVGAAALSVGVLAEAAASRWMARGVVRDLRDESTSGSPSVPLTLGEIVAFYVPLALTSVLAMAVQPMVTFFMGQSRFALESLAVLPVVLGLTFIFRSLGLSYQEVGIALLRDEWDRYVRLRRFAVYLGVATTAGLALIAFTPLSVLWFHDVSGLPMELTGFAVLPLRLMVLIPSMSVMLAFQRSLLVHARSTASITWSTLVVVCAIGAILFLGIRWWDLPGAVAAAAALFLGRVPGNALLLWPCRRVVRALRTA